MRTFKVIDAHRQGGYKTTFNEGRYISSTPMGAVKKAFTKICSVNKIHRKCNLIITIQETSMNSKKKQFAYKLSRKLLKQPIIRLAGTDNEFEIKYETKVTSVPKTKIKGGNAFHSNNTCARRELVGGARKARSTRTRKSTNDFEIDVAQQKVYKPVRFYSKGKKVPKAKAPLLSNGDNQFDIIKTWMLHDNPLTLILVPLKLLKIMDHAKGKLVNPEKFVKKHGDKYKQDIERNKYLMKTLGITSYINIDVSQTKKVSISRGVYSVVAAKELGYTHIPALISFCESEALSELSSDVIKLDPTATNNSSSSTQKNSKKQSAKNKTKKKYGISLARAMRQRDNVESMDGYNPNKSYSSDNSNTSGSDSEFQEKKKQKKSIKYPKRNRRKPQRLENESYIPGSGEEEEKMDDSDYNESDYNFIASSYDSSSYHSSSYDSE